MLPDLFEIDLHNDEILVLILVVMEDAPRLFNFFTLNLKLMCLNPCCN